MVYLYKYGYIGLKYKNKVLIITRIKEKTRRQFHENLYVLHKIKSFSYKK